MQDKNTNIEELQKRIEALEIQLSLIRDSLSELEQVNNPKAVRITGSLETIKIVPLNVSQDRLVEIYNDIPQLLLAYIFKVSLTPESFRKKTQGQIFLERANRGNYWIVATNCDRQEQYWLLPAANLTITIHTLKSFQDLFALAGYPPSENTEFMLSEPARVSRLPNGNIWKLEQRGIVEFGKDKYSSQFFSALEKNNQKYQQLQSQVKLLQAQLERETQKRQQTDKKIAQMSDLLWQLQNELNREKVRPKSKPETQQIREERTVTSSPNWQNVRLLHTLTGHTNTIRSLVVWNWQQNSSKQIIASGSLDSTIKIWNLQTGQLINTLTGTSMVNAIAISPDGYTLISNGDNNTIQVWNLDTALHRVLSGHSNLVLALAISPDGKTLLSGSRDHTLKLWDINAGAIIDTVTEDCGNTITALAFSPDGRVLFSSSSDYNIRIWDFNCDPQPKVILNRILLKYSDLIWSTAIAFTARVIVGGSRDSTIRLWDIDTGELQKTLRGHSDIVWSVAVSPDERFIASGSADGTIALWHLSTGELLCTLSDHSQEVYSVAFSPDGRFLVSGSRDQTIKVWQPELLGSQKSEVVI